MLEVLEVNKEEMIPLLSLLGWILLLWTFFLGLWPKY